MSDPIFPSSSPSSPPSAGGFNQPQPPLAAAQRPLMYDPAGLQTTAPVTLAPKPRRARTGRWIALGVSVALLLALLGGGGAYAYAQYTAPGTAVTQFCAHLKAGDYRAAYASLSTGLRGQVSADQFVQDGQALDQAEGKVRACAQATGSGAYHYTLFANTASVQVSIARNAVRHGSVALKNESGDWKIDSLATSLLGVSLQALQALHAFCTALEQADYSGASALLDSTLLATYTQDEGAFPFTDLLRDHDSVDGSVSSCAPVGVGSGNTDSAASLVVHITRSKPGNWQGTIRLVLTGGAWKLDGLEQVLLGSDLGSVQMAIQFCVDLTTGDLVGAYQNITSSAFQAAIKQAQFIAFFQLGKGLSYTGCNVDLTTYKSSGTVASFDVAFMAQDTATGQTLSVPATLTFVRESVTWKLQQVQTHS